MMTWKFASFCDLTLKIAISTDVGFNVIFKKKKRGKGRKKWVLI